MSNAAREKLEAIGEALDDLIAAQEGEDKTVTNAINAIGCGSRVNLDGLQIGHDRKPNNPA